MTEGTGGVPGEPEWRSAVSVHEDEALARALGTRLRPLGAPRSVSVTDLLAPRRAFWRSVGPPIAFPEERELRLEGGRRLHRLLGPLLAAQGSLEVRVRRDGLHGRVDVLADRPIEVKTTHAPLAPDDVRRSRPDHVDQLGMYSALVDDPHGRLIYFRLADDRVEQVAAYDLEFDTLGGIRSEMGRRADQLRRALEAGRATELPRCAWFGRGCEYQAAGACDCTGTEPLAGPVAVDHASAPVPRPDVAEPLAVALRALPPSTGAPVVERFRDLLYPRRAFFRRVLSPPAAPTTRPTAGEGSDLFRRLSEAVEGGRVGEVNRLPTRSEEPDEEVGGLLGEPYLLRTSRLHHAVPAREWIARSPQYALELGFRCVATGTSAARLIVGYDQLGAERERIQVVRLSFAPVSVFSRVWRARSGALAEALASGDPSSLPACARWMYETCDYRAVCGCGSPEGRVQWKRTVEAVRTKPSDS